MIPRPPTIVLYALCAVAALLVTMRLVSAATVAMDDLRYGRPRLMALQVDPNPTDQDQRLTTFLALNADKQVMVLEIPPAQADATRVLSGPYLPGINEEL